MEKRSLDDTEETLNFLDEKIAELKGESLPQPTIKAEQILDEDVTQHTKEYFLSEQFVKDEAVKELGLSIEKVEKLMALGNDKEKVKLATYLTETFNAMAEKEIKLGKLTTKQYNAMKDKYIPHMATDEGLEFFLRNIQFEHNGKWNPQTAAVGIFKSFDKHRTFQTLDEANAAMKKAGVDKAFETNLSDIFVARAIGHNNLIFDDEMSGALRTIFGKTHKIGSVREGYTLTARHEDIKKRILAKLSNDAGENVYKIPDELLKQYDIEPILFSQNMPYLKLTDEQVARILKDTAYTGKNNKGNKALETFELKDELFDRLNHQSRIQMTKMNSDMVNFYDKYLVIYKLWNSSINPGFHIQNSVGNAFNSFMSDGMAVLSPERYTVAFDIFNGKNPSKTININGNDFSYKHLKKLSEKYGILSNTFFKEDIAHAASKTTKLGEMGVNPKFDPTNISEFEPYRQGAKVGSTIEGTQRLVLFIKNLEDGKTIEEAVNNVNRFLFDYSDLTKVEKQTMKRIIPFYTYMRKNVPLQLEQIFENPALYRNIDKGINNIQGTYGEDEVPREERSEWKRDHIQMPFEIGGKAFGIDPNLSYQQLDRITPNRLLGQSTPAIKNTYRSNDWKVRLYRDRY